MKKYILLAFSIIFISNSYHYKNELKLEKPNWYALTVFCIKEREDLKLKPYRCVANYKTVGWGYNLDANGHKDINTVNEANEAFKEIFEKKIIEVKTKLPHLNNHQSLAVASVAYNIRGGLTAFLKTKAGKAATKGEKDITKELLNLVYYIDPTTKKPKKARGLVIRRNLEAKIYKGDIDFYNKHFENYKNIIKSKILNNEASYN